MLSLSRHPSAGLSSQLLSTFHRFQSTSSSASTSTHDYSNTISLPSTSFSNRSNEALINSILKPQVTEHLYKWNSEKKISSIDELFILHDGPPYANADIHIGHALNKILKDFINRFQLLQGKKVFYKVGWDCHGLPIELKALESLKKKNLDREKKLNKEIKSAKASNNTELYAELQDQLKRLKSNKLSSSEIMQLAKYHALNSQKSQAVDFEKLAIMTDFNDPYMTLDKSFVINQLKIFKLLFDNDLIKRQSKPVYWSCENQTALAEGELEYNESHNSIAAYVKFPLSNDKIISETENSISNIRKSLESGNDSPPSLSLLIWTSTPWTLPSNRAISINEGFDYTLLKDSRSSKPEYLIVAKDLVSQMLQLEPELVETGIIITGKNLVGLEYTNPLLQDNSTKFPVIHGDHVTNSAGTGLVHTAPGHGNDDYLIGLKNGILPYSPVDQYGKYTSDLHETLHDDLLGKQVLKQGNSIVLEKLSSFNALFYKDPNYIHSYPYDWRSKKPIIIRSTPQWFIDVSKIKEKTSHSVLNQIDFLPEKGRNRLNSFVKTRNEWCISRQRSWGVPIPVIYNAETDTPIMTDESINQIIKVVEEEDIYNWFDENDIQKWLPDSLRKDSSSSYYKGNDTMDVWFDSGSSWKLIEDYLISNNLIEEANQRKFLADVYLEGSDQHRGWFQSSLLNKIGIQSDKPQSELVLPYKQIITHGFTLDEKGNKMSKSIGNSILPKMLLEGDKQNKIPKLGIDGLRLWVSSCDYTGDVSIGPVILSHTAENLIKIRFTLKFLLGNLNGYTKEQNREVKYENLNLLDKSILYRLKQLEIKNLESYKAYNFSRVIKDINQFINVDLSSNYFYIKKDILYTNSSDSTERVNTQFVLSEILKYLLVTLSPILPIMTQEAWNNASEIITKGLQSPAMNKWCTLDEKYSNNERSFKDFNKMQLIIDKFKMILDKGTRIDKLIKNPLEVQINLNCDSAKSPYLYNLLDEEKENICDYFVVSKFNLNQPLEENEFIYREIISIPIGADIIEQVELQVTKSDFEKCPRCWKYNKEHEEKLCHKCNYVISEH